MSQTNRQSGFRHNHIVNTNTSHPNMSGKLYPSRSGRIHKQIVKPRLCGSSFPKDTFFNFKQPSPLVPPPPLITSPTPSHPPSANARPLPHAPTKSSLLKVDRRARLRVNAPRPLCLSKRQGPSFQVQQRPPPLAVRTASTLQAQSLGESATRGRSAAGKCTP